MAGIGWKTVIGIGGKRLGRHGNPQLKCVAARFLSPVPAKPSLRLQDARLDRGVQPTPVRSREGHPATRGRRP
jgi:hypothetical protein